MKLDLKLECVCGCAQEGEHRKFTVLNISVKK
jgi:hypothetical protein